jgi:hypothetical protein
MRLRRRSNTEILNALDKALDSVLGPVVRRVIYVEVEQVFGVKRIDIPDEPDKFVQVLRMIFGVASSVLERVLAGEVAENLGLACDKMTLKDVFLRAKGEQ